MKWRITRMHRYSDYTNNKKNLCREDKSLNGHLTKPKRDVLPAIEIGPNTKPPNTPKRCKTRASHRITRITPQTNLHSVNYYPALPQVRFGFRSECGMRAIHIIRGIHFHAETRVSLVFSSVRTLTWIRCAIGVRAYSSCPIRTWVAMYSQVQSKFQFFTYVTFLSK